MNLKFELSVIENGVSVYDQMIGRINDLLQSVDYIKTDMPQDVWSGEGREAFDQAVTAWVNRTRVVVSEVVQTREGLAFAGNKGDEMKRICESFGDSY